MSADGLLGLAVLSFAHNHQHHWVRTFRSDPRVEVIGFWDDDDSRAASAEADHGLKRFRSLDALLDDRRVRAAAICSETYRHRELTGACAARGIHVLCEKPVAHTLEDALAMRHAVRKTGIQYYQSSPQRLLPANRRIRELVRSGAIGRVTHVRKRHGHHFALAGLEKEMPWIVDPASAGGGALLDEGIHEADALRALLGEAVSVTAMLSRPERFAVEAGGTALFRFEADVTAVLESAWNWPAGGPTTEIYGEEGVIIESLTDRASNSPGQFWPHLAVYRAGEGQWRESADRFDFSRIHTLAPRAFIDALVERSPIESTIDDGIAALELVLAAYRSAETGRRIDLPLEETS